MTDRDARELIKRIVGLWQAGDEYAAIDALGEVDFDEGHEDYPDVDAIRKESFDDGYNQAKGEIIDAVNGALRSFR